MKRFFALLLIATVIIVVLVFLTNPSLLDDIWLWLIGFAGSIIGLFRNLFDQLKDAFKKDTPPLENKPIPVAVTEKDITASEKKLNNLKKEIKKNESILNDKTPFLGTTITLIRFTHDENTTLGLLYVRGKFVAYTLEDTYRKKKIKGKTRIPAGDYPVEFREDNNPPSNLTQKYRNRQSLSSFFTHHLEVKNIENFDFVYIHIGNDHGDTDGCILIADGIHATTLEKSIMNSVKAYTRFYKRIQALLEGGEKVRIVIYDEDWLEKFNLHNLNT